MKRKLPRLFLLVLVAIIGWFGGYLQLPPFNKNANFWLGFAACIALISFLFITFSISGKKVTNSPDKSIFNQISKAFTRTWFLLASTLIVFVFVIYLFYINRDLKYQLNDLKENRLIELSQLNRSIHKNNQQLFVDNVLNTVDKEIGESHDRKISDQTIARISALCESFKPYRYIINDTLSSVALSPGRGRILLAMVLMKMDSACFEKIKRTSTFSGADLRGANLKGYNLNGIDLLMADLSNSNLTGTKLRNSELNNANFSQANLSEADLSNSNMRRTNFSWAILNKANLSASNMNGVNLENAQMADVDATSTTFQYAILNGSILVNSNLQKADFAGASLVRANLSYTDLSDARLPIANIRFSIMNQIDLSHVEIQHTWLEELKKASVIGAEFVLKNFHIVGDSSRPNQGPIYFLERKQ